MDLKLLKPDYQSSQSSHNHMLSITEYEEISRRLEDSHQLLDLVKSCLSDPENLENSYSHLTNTAHQLTYPGGFDESRCVFMFSELASAFEKDLGMSAKEAQEACQSPKGPIYRQIVDVVNGLFDAVYNQADAEGFIKLFGLPQKVEALTSGAE